jgi:inosine-uridine nucleoside N-ribohydrolase
MPRKLILDVDTGTDDAVAIMLAALHPALELIGVTTVNGNVEVAHCTDNSSAAAISRYSKGCTARWRAPISRSPAH